MVMKKVMEMLANGLWKVSPWYRRNRATKRLLEALGDGGGGCDSIICQEDGKPLVKLVNGVYEMPYIPLSRTQR